MSIINLSSPRATRSVFLLAAVYLYLYWHFFFHLDVTDGSRLYAFVAQAIGSDGTWYLKQLIRHGITAMFLLVAVCIWQVGRSLAEREGAATPLPYRLAPVLIPLALSITVVENLGNIFQHNNPILRVSYLFRNYVENALNAPFMTYGAWSVTGPYPIFWTLPYGYYLWAYPWAWIVAGNLPLVALVLLWRMRIRLDGLLADDPRESATSAPLIPIPAKSTALVVRKDTSPARVRRPGRRLW